MGLFDRFRRNKVEQLADTTITKVPEKKRFSKNIKKAQIPKAEMELEEFKVAVAAAENIEMPDRRLLLSFYKQTVKDGHLRSQLRTAHNTIQQSEFKIQNESKKELKDKLKYFERSWFTDFVTHAIDSEFYGHSLIELVEKDEEGFSKATLIPRYHVIPNTGEVVFDYDEDLKIPYRDYMKTLGLIEIGDKEDLGLLEIATREVTWKLYSRSDWSQHSEKFGMPLLSIETETVDDKELDKIEDMAANFGSNGYVIVNKGDTVDIKTPNSGSGTAHHIYKDKIEACNDEISKLINGQTMTSDDGASYAQGEVHERILNSYTLARMARIQREVNDKLIPYLIENGYPLKGCKFQYLDLEKQEKKQTAPTEQTKTTDEKKKPNSNLADLSYQVRMIYDGFHEGLELGLFKGISLSIFNKVMERLHKLASDNKLPKDDKLVQEAEELVKATFNKLDTAFKQGLKLAKYEPDKLFIARLSNGLWEFSGFKTKAQLLEAKELLLDDKGELKAWNKFRDDILDIHESYNVNYLRAEYDHVISASQAAATWKQHEENADIVYLQYRTAGDERVRQSHKGLDKITLPVDDTFWDKFYPPNGWGCRCYVKEVLKTRYEPSDSKKANEAGEASMVVTNSKGEANKEATEKAALFKFNPGKSERLFPEGHPYFKA